jgi:hypothetical protein
MLHVALQPHASSPRRRPNTSGGGCFCVPQGCYIAMMARKPLELPMQVAKAFVKDMRAFHAEPNAIKRDEIAARQLHVLWSYNPPRAKKLRIHDVKEMFEEMKDQG